MSDERIPDGEQVMEDLLGWRPEYTDANRELMEHAVKQLFGEVWKRPALSWRDRELITLAILAEQGGRENQLKVHIRAAHRIGLSREELMELLVHVSQYSGYPAAFATLSALNEVLAEESSAETPD